MKRTLLYIFIFSLVTLAFAQDSAKGYDEHLGLEQGMRNSRVTDMVQDNLGRIWMATEGGLHVWDGYRFSIYTTDNSGISSDELNAVYYEKKRNTLWIGTKNDGLCSFCLDSLTWHSYNAQSGLLANCVTDIEAASDGGLWVAYYLRGADHIDVEGNISHYLCNAPGYADDGCWSIVDDNHGHIIMGTLSCGICITDIKSRKSVFYDYSGKEIPNSGGIQALCLDKKRHLLIGSDNAVFVFDINKGKVLYSIPADGHVFSLAETSEGRTLIGDKGILSIMQDRAGNIWRTDERRGVSIEMHEKTPFIHTDSVMQFPKVSGLDGVQEIRKDGNVTWVSTTHGLYRQENGGSPQPMTSIDSRMKVHNINDLAIDKLGRLWLGTYGDGLYVFTREGRLVLHQNDSILKNVNMIVRDHIDRMWVTSRKGLEIFNGTEKPVLQRCLDSNSGISDLPVYLIIEDKGGNMWLGAGSSILCVNEGSWSVKTYTSADGVPYGMFLKGRIALREDGSIAFGQQDRTCVFHPEKVLGQHRKLSPCFASSITLLSAKGGEGMQQKALPISAGDFIFAHDENSFLITLGTSDVAQAGNVNYRYQIEGLGEQWYPVGSDHSFIVQGLHPGHYTLHIQASLHNTGDWNDLMPVSITICQPWYWTWWARIIYVLLLISIIIYEWRQYHTRLLLERQLDDRLALHYASQHQAESAQTAVEHNTESVQKTEASASTGSLNKLDKEFLESIDNLISSNISEEDLDIQKITDAIGMSHSSLYRRLRSLTGMSINEYIRKHRIKKSMQLLLDGYNINEVSMQCGFSTPNYFRRCFKAEYGCSPSEFIANHSI